ncbi:trypsin-like peptidase domain-containing protein [Candidatus Uhrbacteria bacterium]|nr:trypsin-like peptidase domain-containing protein [Candidatus Uhrbacteria bacterium]
MEDRRVFLFASQLAICATVSALIAFLVAYNVRQTPSVASVQAPPLVVSMPPDIPDVVSAVQPSIVAVDVAVDEEFVPKQLLDTLPEPDLSEIHDGVRRVSSGSGFFVTEQGLVVTNRHVIDIPDVPANKHHISIVSHGGQNFDATVTAIDPVLDIAFLSVSSTRGIPFPILSFASSSRLRVGETVLAVGNALSEFPNTVTRGVVSGLNRRILAEDDFGEEMLEEAIQTDAAINPGNSGGPLLNVYGKVVGMNTAVAIDGQSLGFALPSDVLLRSIESVKLYGRVIRPFLGIRYELREEGGAEILSGVGAHEPAIVIGSPADHAGLREGDVVIAIDGVSIDDVHTPVQLIGKHQVGDRLHIDILRHDIPMSFDISLVEFVP